MGLNHSGTAPVQRSCNSCCTAALVQHLWSSRERSSCRAGAGLAGCTGLVWMLSRAGPSRERLTWEGDRGQTEAANRTEPPALRACHSLQGSGCAGEGPRGKEAARSWLPAVSSAARGFCAFSEGFKVPQENFGNNLSVDLCSLGKGSCWPGGICQAGSPDALPAGILGRNVAGLSLLGVKVSGCPGRILGNNLSMHFYSLAKASQYPGRIFQWILGPWKSL